MQEMAGNMGSIPGSVRLPGGGHDNPLQYSCLENCMDRGAWLATVHGVTKSQIQWATVHAHTHPFLKHAWEHERVEGEIGTAVAGWHRPSVESSQVQSCETNIWITEFSPRGGHRRSARSTDLSDVHSIYLQSLDLRLCFEVLGINYFLKRPSSSLWICKLAF